MNSSFPCETFAAYNQNLLFGLLLWGSELPSSSLKRDVLSDLFGALHPML